MIVSLALGIGANVIPADGLADFRSYATRQDVTIPFDGATDTALQQELTAAIARTKWGDAGAYSVLALIDPTVRAAIKTFERASQLLGPGSPSR